MEVLQLLAVVSIVQLVEAGIGLRLAVYQGIGEVGVPLIFATRSTVSSKRSSELESMNDSDGDP